MFNRRFLGSTMAIHSAYIMRLTGGREDRMEGELPDLGVAELEVDDNLGNSVTMTGGGDVGMGQQLPDLEADDALEVDDGLAVNNHSLEGRAIAARYNTSSYNTLRMAFADDFDAGQDLKADDAMEADDGLEADDDVEANGFYRKAVEKGPPDEPSRPWYIMLDFDGTITRKDTLDALICQAILWNYEHVVDGGGRFLELREVFETEQWLRWEEAKNAYMADLGACRRGIQACEASVDLWRDREHVAGMFAQSQMLGDAEPKIKGYSSTYCDEVEILESQRPIEEFSLERVNATGILDHVGADSILKKRAIHSERHQTPADIAKTVGFEKVGVSARPGFREFTEELEKRPGSAWGVISVNWSRDWIEGIILKELGVDNVEKSKDQHIPIISNSPLPPSPRTESPKIPTPPAPTTNGMSYETHIRTGSRMQNEARRISHPELRQSTTAVRPPRRGIVGPQLPQNRFACQRPCCPEQDPALILTTEDKLGVRERMLGMLQAKSTIRGSRPSNIYIGDSATDFSCLLRSDVGIIMCDEPLPPPGSPEPLEPANHPIVKMLHDCGYVTRHVRDYRMLYEKVNDGSEDSPYVQLLWARDFYEIRDCGLLSTAHWKAIETARRKMADAAHKRNEAALRKT